MARIDEILKAGDVAVTRSQVKDFMQQVRAQLVAAESEQNEPRLAALIGQYDRLEARLRALGEEAAGGDGE